MLQPADTIQMGDKALGPEDLQLVAAENAFLEPRCYVKHTISLPRQAEDKH